MLDCDASPIGPEAREWFAVYVIPRHEKRVARHLTVRAIEHFLPLYQSLRRWKGGSKVTLQLPLFPAYVFVRIARGGRVPVLEVPGVVALVGSGRHGAAISDTYMSSLRESVLLGKVEPEPYLAAGTRVRVRSGLMAGAEGVLVRRKGSFRVVLTLDPIMRSISVEVDSDDVEPVGACPSMFSSRALVGTNAA